MDGAAKYLIEISLSPTFGAMIDSVTTNNVHFSPWSLNKYPNNQVYYWRVSMIDRDNKRGPASDAVLILGSGRRVYLPFQTR